jgi:hypothetical protein
VSDNVVILPVVTTLDLPAERLLNAALETGLKAVVIVGYDLYGEEYFASSMADGSDVIWHLERAKLKLLRMSDDE